MSERVIQIVREDGEVLYEGLAVPVLVAHGDPEVWSYDLSGLPPLKTGDSLRVTETITA